MGRKPSPPDKDPTPHGSISGLILRVLCACAAGYGGFLLRAAASHDKAPFHLFAFLGPRAADCARNRQLLSVVALQRRCPPRHLRNAFSSVLRIGRPLSDVLSPHSPYVP